MPHITIEYTPTIQGLNPSTLLQQVHRSLLEAGVFEPHDVKTRIRACSDFRVGEPPDDDWTFVHVELRLLSGRPADVRRDLSERVAQAVETCIRTDAATERRVQVSVDVVDMDKGAYSKRKVSP